MATVAVPSAVSTRVPWYIWTSALAVASAQVGVQWDISWHRSIGRDAFLTPAHIAIYLCGVLAGIVCGYLILATTFGKTGLGPTSIRIWGFRGPLGAFVAAWGGLVMLTSAPFDDWWHKAYGLDVKILSPPHMVLAIGMITVQAGALLLIASYMNRAEGRSRRILKWLFLYVAAMTLAALFVLVLELIGRPWMHTGRFYRVVCLLAPPVFALASRGSGDRWAGTRVAAIYTGFLLALLYILPLFPAEPKLGPVYHKVHQFIPAGFPLLFLFPAAALDWLYAKTRSWNAWRVSLYAGTVFFAIFAAVQWPFADFLMSPAAHNALFGSLYLDYFSGPTTLLARNLYIPAGPKLQLDLAVAAILAILTTRLGLAIGSWIRDVRR